MVVKLAVRNGSFGYGDRILFENVSIEAEDKGVLTILGPNGAGKTSFLKCLMSINKWTSGTSELEGKDISTMSPKEITRHIAYVPQMKGASFDYSVRDMVMMGRASHIRIYESPGDRDMEIVDGYMERLGISALAERRFNTLSGGEMQMATIARALVSEPSILILDEPESSLDYSNQLKILDLISELSEEMLCIINTHYPEHALRISDHTLMLDGKGGSIYGPTGDVITEENIERVFGVHARIGSFEHEGEIHKFIVPLGRLQ